MQDNPNYIDKMQINIVVNRNEICPLEFDSESFYKNIISKAKEISKELFDGSIEDYFHKESHRVTVNLVGNFHPYPTDSDKHNDSILEYDNDKEWKSGETIKVINEIFKNYKIHVFLGEMSFSKLV